MQVRPVFAALVLTVGLAGCGGGGGTPAAAPTTPAPAATAAPTTDPATAAITAAFQGFFNPAGTLASHMALLQDGAQFQASLAASAKDPSAKNLSAKVTNVVVTGTTAAVTYNLLGAGGVALLTGAQGKAVDVGGKWLVSKITYCQLLGLQNPTAKIPGCV